MSIVWKDVGKRIWGAGFAFSGIVGLGGVESNILNWLGWLKINPYVTGGAFGVMGLCGLLYIVARWGVGSPRSGIASGSGFVDMTDMRLPFCARRRAALKHCD